MKQQIMDLWKEAFNDTDEFIHLFFSRFYNEENTLTIRQNNRVISALQIIPYEMIYYGQRVPVGYICGVSTLHSERGKGWMKQLMQCAYREMVQRRYALSVLIPASGWLFDYYKKLGYTTIFDKSEETYHSYFEINERFHIQKVQENIYREAYEYYNRIQLQRKYAILHSGYDFETIIKDCELEGGAAWTVRQNGQIAGLAFVIPAHPGHLLIKEIVYDRIEIKKHLIHFLSDYYRTTLCRVRIPPIPQNSIPYGMARILDKEAFLPFYLSANPDPGKVTGFLTDESVFTQLIFHYNRREAFMNLMFD